MRRVVTAFLLLALLLVVHPAWAKRKPQPEATLATGSIAVGTVYVAPEGDGDWLVGGPTVHIGDAVTFDVVVADLAPGEYPYIWVRCFAAGDWVYQKTGSPLAMFLITAGDTCTATLNAGVNNESQRVNSEELASVTFHVTG